MQIHIRLNKSEYQSLLNVANWVLKNQPEPRTFGEYQRQDALRGMVTEMIKRIPELKDKVNMTLKSEEATALYELTDVLGLPPYEQALMMRIFGQVDQEWQSRANMQRSNSLLMLPEGGVA